MIFFSTRSIAINLRRTLLKTTTIYRRTYKYTILHNIAERSKNDDVLVSREKTVFAPANMTIRLHHNN